MDCQINDTRWPKTLFDDVESRKPGLHLGEVTRSLRDSAGLGYKGDGFTDMELTAEIGLLWEDVLGKVMGDKYAIRPPQMKKDGIWMAPDGIGPDPAGEVPMVVEEYKATWKSAKRSPIEDFAYMTQAKSYCYAMGTNVVIFRVFYLMGEYKGGGPVYRVARIVYSDKELEDNWRMIVQYKEQNFPNCFGLEYKMTAAKCRKECRVIDRCGELWRTHFVN